MTRRKGRNVVIASVKPTIKIKETHNPTKRIILKFAQFLANLFGIRKFTSPNQVLVPASLGFRMGTITSVIVMTRNKEYLVNQVQSRDKKNIFLAERQHTNVALPS